MAVIYGQWAGCRALITERRNNTSRGARLRAVFLVCVCIYTYVYVYVFVLAVGIELSLYHKIYKIVLC